MAVGDSSVARRRRWRKLIKPTKLNMYIQNVMFLLWFRTQDCGPLNQTRLGEAPVHRRVSTSSFKFSSTYMYMNICDGKKYYRCCCCVPILIMTSPPFRTSADRIKSRSTRRIASVHRNIIVVVVVFPFS